MQGSGPVTANVIELRSPAARSLVIVISFPGWTLMLSVVACAMPISTVIKLETVKTKCSVFESLITHLNFLSLDSLFGGTVEQKCTSL